MHRHLLVASTAWNAYHGKGKEWFTQQGLGTFKNLAISSSLGGSTGCGSPGDREFFAGQWSFELTFVKEKAPVVKENTTKYNQYLKVLESWNVALWTEL